MPLNTYDEVVEFIFNALPDFQKIGYSAINNKLTTTLELCQFVGNPQDKLKFIHLAGTNGKGSSSHMIASVLQSAGYKTGLYTSPHLIDFCERIRINGQVIEQSFVIEFINKISPVIEKLKPSFFEMTTVMAFDYFYSQNVEIVVLETGLGGRLDSTNVIKNPEACIITNIGLDHTQLLGNTLKEIALEKAGIFKESIPVILSQFQEETDEVFVEAAKRLSCPISRGEEVHNLGIENSVRNIRYKHKNYQTDLTGLYQLKNLQGVFKLFEILNQNYWVISDDAIYQGLKNVSKNTNLKGRWQVVENNPLVVCDTAHNTDGVQELLNCIQSTSFTNLHLIIGMVKDKNISSVLELLPSIAFYYWTQSSSYRSSTAEDLQKIGENCSLHGKCYSTVNEAIKSSKLNANNNDLIVVFGSNYLIAEIKGL